MVKRPPRPSPSPLTLHRPFYPHNSSPVFYYSSLTQTNYFLSGYTDFCPTDSVITETFDRSAQSLLDFPYKSTPHKAPVAPKIHCHFDRKTAINGANMSEGKVCNMPEGIVCAPSSSRRHALVMLALLPESPLYSIHCSFCSGNIFFWDIADSPIFRPHPVIRW